jgi:hypothetical protein
MKETLKVIGLSMIVTGLVLAMVGLIVFGNQLAAGTGKVYNCNVSEFSPDFTTAMREECRKLKKEQYEKDPVRKSGTQV